MTRDLVPVAVLALSVSGCSFGLVSRYSEPPPGMVSGCTESYRWPVVDTIVAAGGAALAIYAVATREDDGTPDTATPVLAGAGSLVGVVAGTSAIFGYLSVRTCRTEKHRFDQR